MTHSGTLLTIPGLRLLLTLIALIATPVCVVAQSTDGPTTSKKIASISPNFIETGGRNLHYASAGDPTKPGLLFIHGTPGGWGAFSRYLSHPDLQHRYFMVSVDRLGWGQSALPKEKQPKSKSERKIGDFGVQASAIAAVFEKYPDKKWIVVGHSLGASIAPKVGVFAPHRVQGLLLLAGSLKPKLGRPRWYNRVASTYLAKWMLSSELNYSNDEIMVLRRELSLMEAEILENDLDIDVVIIQGKKDKLVSPKNAQYAKESWSKSFKSVSTIELEDAGHFIPWEQFPLVVKSILSFLR